MNKLYTEEQLRQVCQFVRGKNVDELIASLTPIELPSDEEIKKGYATSQDSFNYYEFIRGAKWMRDKIQGGNNG